VAWSIEYVHCRFGRAQGTQVVRYSLSCSFFLFFFCFRFYFFTFVLPGLSTPREGRECVQGTRRRAEPVGPTCLGQSAPSVQSL
jgi:hypothetical protein